MTHLWPQRRSYSQKIRPSASPPTVESILTALANGPLPVSELAPVDPIAIWGGPQQKEQARAVAAPALIDAEDRGFCVSFRRGGHSGHVLWKLTDLGREVLAGRERGQ
jgi:hypothetical protein